MQTAIFGGGCFWCTEAIFSSLKGVISVTPGYSGGSVPNPTSEQVYSKTTGHAEAVKIEFNPEEITFRDLMDVFFGTHNPTTLNRQDYDVGPLYRSSIFYMDENQKKEAQETIAEFERNKTFADPIITSLEPFKAFYEAENYHKNFFERNPNSPYCQAIISPKLAKLRAKFAGKLKGT